MWYNLTLEYVPQRVPRGAERVFTMGLFTKLFGTRSEREVKKLDAQVEAAYTMIADIETLSDDALAEYDAIAEAEAEAQEKRRGLWSESDPVAPWEWRKQQRQKKKPVAPSEERPPADVKPAA